MISVVMRISFADPRVALLGLVVGCQPPPTEVSTESPGESSGPPSTTTSPVGTTMPSEGTTAASDGPSPDGTTSSSSGAEGSASTSSSGSEGESSTGEPMDEPLGPFGPPVEVTELNSGGSDDDPTLTGDLLEIYFASNRDGDEDIWMSTRASVSDPWDDPVSVESLNTPFTETFPEVSLDGLVLLIASDRGQFGDLDVFYSARADRGEPWPDPESLDGAANDDFVDYGATPIPDMSRVLLCRDVQGGLGQSDVWEAPLDLRDWTVGRAVHVPELSSVAADCTASVSPSGREIFFESTRPNGTLWSLWTATREDPTGPWDDPVAVAELDGDSEEVDPWLSPDRRTLWYARGYIGAYDLYVATRE